MLRFAGLLVGPLVALALLDVSGALTTAGRFADLNLSIAAERATAQDSTPPASQQPGSHPEMGVLLHSTGPEADPGHQRRHRERLPVLMGVVERATRVLAAPQQSPRPDIRSDRSPSRLTAYAPLRL
jgi:hypothetical protein